jgi:hypothetical protein
VSHASQKPVKHGRPRGEPKRKVNMSLSPETIVLVDELQMMLPRSITGRPERKNDIFEIAIQHLHETVSKEQIAAGVRASKKGQ